MKICIRCNLKKPLNQFYCKPRRTGEVHSYCKQCFNRYTTDRFRRRKVQAVEFLGGKCMDCNGVFPYFVFDFHHLDPTKKDVEFTTLRRRTWKAIELELEKCVLVCANCHRIRHWQRFSER